MADEHHTTKIVDIDMPFMSMVGFMLKWTLATIPAMMILIGLGALVFGTLGGFVGGI